MRIIIIYSIDLRSSLGIFVTQTANDFPEILYTLMFQIENKILVHNSNAGMDNVHFRHSNCCEHSKVEKVIITFVLPTVVFVLIASQFALAQTNQTTTWTKYTDPQGRFSINRLMDSP